MDNFGRKNLSGGASIIMFSLTEKVLNHIMHHEIYN